MKWTSKSNQGFSLVELIIVIAIMAILIAVMAPQLIKYVEKANVEADLSTLDAIYKAVEYARIDPTVLKDIDSQAQIDSLATPQTLEQLLTPNDTVFAQTVLDTVGWDDLNQATYEKVLKSSHASDCEIYVVYQGTFVNPLAMWITTTDNTGKKDKSNRPTTIEDIGNCISIK